MTTGLNPSRGTRLRNVASRLLACASLLAAGLSWPSGEAQGAMGEPADDVFTFVPDGTDRVEIGPEGEGNLSWPNLLREAGGRLRLLVRGPAGGSTRNAVLAYERLG